MMARGDRNMGWPGFFRVFTVLCAIMLLLSQQCQQLVAAGSGVWQVLSVYEGLTWTVPALFMLWGMFALEEGKPLVSASLLGLALPAFFLLVFWGAVYAVVSHLLGGGVLSWAGVWAALVSAAKGNTYFHLWVLYPLIGLYLVHPVIHRFTSSASRGSCATFWPSVFSLHPFCPCGPPSTPAVCWPGSWSGLESIWCWAGWAAMWAAGICGALRSAALPNTSSTSWACWDWYSR